MTKTFSDQNNNKKKKRERHCFWQNWGVLQANGECSQMVSIQCREKGGKQGQMEDSESD